MVSIKSAALEKVFLLLSFHVTGVSSGIENSSTFRLYNKKCFWIMFWATATGLGWQVWALVMMSVGLREGRCDMLRDMDDTDRRAGLFCVFCDSPLPASRSARGAVPCALSQGELHCALRVGYCWSPWAVQAQPIGRCPSLPAKC